MERHGDALYRYAWVRLRNRAAAEDLVQETLLQAFKCRASFKGRSSEKSWLFSILRHNLIDLFRRNKVREGLSLETAEDLAGLASPFHEAGLQKGSWRAGSEPADWHSPEADLSQREFWNVFHHCASKLPPAMSQVLLLREIDGLPSDQICGIAGVSANHLWVLLHRARLALQRCLQSNWFQ